MFLSQFLERRRKPRVEPVDAFGQVLQELAEGAHKQARAMRLERFTEKFFGEEPDLLVLEGDVMDLILQTSMVESQIRSAALFLFSTDLDVLYAYEEGVV